MSLLDLLGVVQVLWNGVAVNPTRKRINIVGGTVADNDALDATEITLPAGDGGEGADLSDDVPEPLGTAAAGDSEEASRANHVHAHGALAGGNLHADVIAGDASGFMTGTQATKLAGIEAGAQVTSFANVSAALAAASTALDVNGQRITDVATPTAGTDAANKAYVDAGGGGGGAWVTALDTDFAAQANATLADGANVIDGHTWTGVNLASGGSAVIVNGSYLRLKGNATSTTINNATRTGPHLKIALADILPAWLGLDAKLRVWLGIKVTGATANSERSACGLFNTTHSAGAMDYVLMYRGWRSASAAVVTRPLAGRNSEGAMEFLDAHYAYVANEIQVFSVNDMIALRGSVLKHGTNPASAWPDARALTLQAGFDLSSNRSTPAITSPRWTSLADVCLMLGCDTGNTNNNTSFQVEVYKVKLEYLP